MATFEEKKLILETKVNRVPRTGCQVVDWEANGQYFGTAKKMEDMIEADFDRIARVLEINFDEIIRGQQERLQRKAERKIKTYDTVKECMCGCGGVTKSRFCPGHDSKFKSVLRKRLADGDNTVMEIIKGLGWNCILANN